VLVAGLADRMARDGPRLDAAVLAALFHDAEIQRRYHEDGRLSGGRARFAEWTMRTAAIGASTRKKGTAAVRAHYGPRVDRLPLAALVHDAEYLAKAGTLGAAVFFIKSTLRGRTLLDAVRNSLSKELTYAAALPANMRTRAGRRLAARKARTTQSFFRDLLGELANRRASTHVARLRPLPSGGRSTSGWS
jgi:HD superfamily phosphodiesterase